MIDKDESKQGPNYTGPKSLEPGTRPGTSELWTETESRLEGLFLFFFLLTRCGRENEGSVAKETFFFLKD